MMNKKLLLKIISIELYKIEKKRREGSITESQACFESEKILQKLPKPTFEDIISIDDQVLTLLEKDK